MKSVNLIYRPLISLLIILFISPGMFSQQGNNLLGSWISQNEFGSISLVFISGDQLEFDGERAAYSLSPGIIRVMDPDYGPMDYAYTLQGNTLQISFPEGDVLLLV